MKLKDEQEIIDEEILEDEIDEEIVEDETKDTKATKAKAPKSKKKKVIAIVAICLCVLIFAGAGIGVYVWLNQKGGLGDILIDESKMNGSYKTDAEVLTGITVPTSDNLEDHINVALQLYNIANANLVKEKAVTIAVRSNSEVLGASTGGYRYFVKNGDEFFNGDFFYVPEGGFMNAAMKTFSTDNTNYAYISYFNFKSNTGHEKKTTKLTYTEDKGVFYFNIDWNQTLFDRDIDKVTDDCPMPDKDYTYCSYVWDTDTIKTCTVTYNAEGGYYEIQLTLDCSKKKTLGDSLKYLREGSGDENAKYTAITETVQIWNNGKFKSFTSYDEWKATRMGLKIESANDYKTQFFYDEYSTTIRNYLFAEEYIASLGY